MIIKLIVGGLLDLLTSVLDAIPNAELPISEPVTAFAELLGGALGGLNGFLPVEEIGVFVAWTMATYLPIRISFEIAKWVYEHLPVVGAGG